MSSMTHTQQAASANGESAPYVTLSLAAFDDLCLALMDAPTRALDVSGKLRRTADSVHFTPAQWVDALNRLLSA